MKKMTTARKSDDSPPLYRIVVRTLQSEIVSGLYPVGTQLPSESALVERFGISRHTVREALRALREAGLVESRQGFGTVVLSPGSQTYVHQVNSISDLFDTNVITQYSAISGDLVSLSGDITRSFSECDNRRWLRIHALRHKPADEVPMSELEAFVASRFAGVGRVMARYTGSIYGLIETIYGETISEVRQDVSAFKADGTVGASIGMADGDAGIEIRRIFRIASDNDIAMVSFNRYPAERFKFSMTLRRQRA